MMPDPVARKRLKKKMLDRWENEGGRIATDPTSVDASIPASEDKGQGRKLSSPSDKSTVAVKRRRSKPVKK